MDSLRKFIEIVPIEFNGSLGIRDKEDYFAMPANVAGDAGWDTAIVSTAALTSGIFTPPHKSATLPSVKIMRLGGWIQYLRFLFKNNDAVLFSNDRVLKSFIACWFGRYNVFMSHQSNLPNQWWKKEAFGFFARRFDAIKVSNPFEKDELMKIGVSPERIHYIPLSIDHEFFGKPASRSVQDKTRKKYGIKKDEKVAIFIANVRKFKKIDTILKAVRRLKEDGVKIKLIIVGKDLLSTENYPDINHMTSTLGIAENIVLTGWLSQEESKEIMDIADLYVNSSIHEGQCLTAYEAAAASLPLCLSNIGSFTSVFTDSALFHQPDDYNKLADNIKHYLSNPRIAKKHADINKRLVKERCDYNVVKKKLKELFLI